MKKIAEVKIINYFSDMLYWESYFDDNCIVSKDFTLRSSAIRNARKFFKKLGYDVEIVK